MRLTSLAFATAMTLMPVAALAQPTIVQAPVPPGATVFDTPPAVFLVPESAQLDSAAIAQRVSAECGLAVVHDTAMRTTEQRTALYSVCVAQRTQGTLIPVQNGVSCAHFDRYPGIAFCVITSMRTFVPPGGDGPPPTSPRATTARR